jgi:hypothetical protein
MNAFPGGFGWQWGCIVFSQIQGDVWGLRSLREVACSRFIGFIVNFPKIAGWQM